MPFYEYVCTLCGKDTTILQKLSDAPAVDCPACGKPGLTKQISAAGFRLKGAGWYETDFKSDKKKNLAGEGSGGAPAAESKSEDKKTEKSEPATSTSPAAAAPAPAAPSKPTASSET